MYSVLLKVKCVLKFLTRFYNLVQGTLTLASSVIVNVATGHIHPPQRMKPDFCVKINK